MAGLLQPYIPDVSQWQQSALRGYQMGSAIRQKNLLQQAGRLAAQGNLNAARNTLYGGGDFKTAQGIESHRSAMATAELARRNSAAANARAISAAARKASDHQLLRALQIQQSLARVAHAIKTPEEFEATKAALAKAGLDVSKYTFKDLPTLQASALDAKDRLKLEMRKRGIGEEYGLAPVYGKENKTGAPVIFQLSKTGKPRIAEIPRGYTLTPGVKTLDTGTGTAIMGARSGVIQGVIPKQQRSAEFEKTVGKNVAKSFTDLRDKALDSQEAIKRNADTLKLLNKGVITGFGANFKLSFGKALNTIGFDVGSDEIANTEAFVAERGRAVANIIKAFGAGTGLSDADRAYAEKIAGGQIALTEKSIRKIITMSNKANRYVLNRYNKQARSVSRGRIPKLEINAPLKRITVKKKDGTTIEVIDLRDDDGTLARTLPKGSRILAPDGSIRVK